jgi:hypothetical protein
LKPQGAAAVCARHKGSQTASRQKVASMQRLTAMSILQQQNSLAAFRKRNQAAI